ncbi:hypothetical protein ABIF79_006455 [Bradyrhizobium japonicum]
MASRERRVSTLRGYGRAERLDAADDCGDRKRDVLLALASHIELLSISNELAMQIALSLVGILVMIGCIGVELDRDQAGETTMTA